MTEDAKVIMSQTEAALFLRRYVCAGCWGVLTEFVIPGGQSHIKCVKCGDGRGFVTRRFTERRRSESIGEALDVKSMMRNIGLVNKRCTADVLEDLGV